MGMEGRDDEEKEGKMKKKRKEGQGRGTAVAGFYLLPVGLHGSITADPLGSLNGRTEGDWSGDEPFMFLCCSVVSHPS